MKKSINILNNNIYFFILLFTTGSLLLQISCDKDETSIPVITRIRLTDPSTADTSLSGVGLGNWVVIHGENLASTKQIFINNYEVYFNATFVTDNTIVVEIPDDTPNVGSDPDVPNIIRIITDYGEAEYDFIIYPPPPQIIYISNEFSQAGDTITVMGSYFYFVEDILFPGNISASGYDIVSANLIYVTVPEGVTEGGNLVIVSQSGLSASPAGARFNDTTGMICNFDDKNTFENWGGVVIDPSTDSRLPEFMGNAYLGTSTNLVPGTWWVQEMAMPIVSGKYPRFNSELSANNMAVKFEIYVNGPWNSGWYEFRLVKRDPDQDYAWVEYYLYPLQLWGDVDNRNDFETDDWITISIPLNNFYLSTDQENLLTSFSQIEDYNFLGMYFVNPSADIGGILMESIAIGVDNIRIIQVSE